MRENSGRPYPGRSQSLLWQETLRKKSKAIQVKQKIPVLLILPVNDPCCHLAKYPHCAQNPPAGVLSEIAFHEKAGRSQGNSGFIVSFCSLSQRNIFSRRVATVAMLPSALSRSDPFSLGACGAFSIQPVLPSVWRPLVALKSGTWPRPLTQSPELGFGFCLFSSWNDFDFVFAFLFYAAAATVSRLLLCNGSYTSPLTHR